MSSASVAVQTAMYSRLDALLSVPVYDHVPQDETPAFVVIGEDQELPADTKTHHGVEHQVEIHIYSKEHGAKQVKTLSGQIYTELHRQPITVTGFSATMLQFDSEVIFPEPEGYRGVIRFRFFTTAQ